MLEMHEYQKKYVDDIESSLKKYTRVLAQLTTGGGKSFCGTIVANKYSHVKVVAHRSELVDQWKEYLKDHPSFEIGTIQQFTHKSAKDSDNDKYGLLIIDEAHHYADNEWHKYLNKWKGKMLGLTATPTRSNECEGFLHIWDVLVSGASKREIIKKSKQVVPFKVLLPRFGEIKGAGNGKDGDFTERATMQLYAESTLQRAAMVKYGVDWLKKVRPDARAIIYTVNKTHAEAVSAYATEQGISNAVVLAETTAKERKKAYAGFKAGTTQCLVSVGVLTEGVDFPWCDTVLLLRPTTSIICFLQMVGRAARAYENKKYALVLDASGNTARLGHPDDEHLWSLAPQVRDTRPAKECVECHTANRAGAKRCEECGAWLPTESKLMGARIVCDICGRGRKPLIPQCPFCQVDVLSAIVTLDHMPAAFKHRNTTWKLNGSVYTTSFIDIGVTAYLTRSGDIWSGGMQADDKDSEVWMRTKSITASGRVLVMRKERVSYDTPFKVVNAILNRVKVIRRNN